MKGYAAGVRRRAADIAEMLQKNNKSFCGKGPIHHFACSAPPRFGSIVPSLLTKKGWRDMGYCW
jgi:hypothetical protein